MTIYYETREIQQNRVFLLKKEGINLIPENSKTFKINFDYDFRILSLWVWLGDDSAGHIEIELLKYDTNWKTFEIIFDFYLNKDKLPYQLPDLVIPKDINYALRFTNESNNIIDNIILFTTPVVIENTIILDEV